VRTGAENRTKVIVATLLFAGAMFLFLRMVLGWGSVSASTPLPKQPGQSDFEKALALSGSTAPARRQRTRSTATTTTAAAAPTLDPTLRLNLLAQSEDVKYEGSGRNIFDRESAPVIPQPVANGKKDEGKPAPPPVYTPPPPPPIPLKFFGFTNTPGEPKQVFLLSGDDTLIAKEGDIVNRRYKVLRINPNSVEIQDMLNNSRQTIPLTQG
jgi:hypothetical protein